MLFMKYLIIIALSFSAFTTFAAKPLSWEKNFPERKAWSAVVYNLLSSELFPAFNSAKDAEKICPGYSDLSDQERIQVWAELISATSYFESTWNPANLLQQNTKDNQASLLDPAINLEFGMRVLADQISKKGSVIISSGAYWDSLKENGKHSKVPQIIKMVSETGLCSQN